MTRDPASDKSKALAQTPGVKVVVWDTSNSEALFEQETVDGMFLVQNVFTEDETATGGFTGASRLSMLADPCTGIELIKLAAKHGVKQLVYSGVDFHNQASTPLVQSVLILHHPPLPSG